MASDEDGFQMVKRRGRHSATSRAPKIATASLELPTATSLSAENILARVEGYKYVLAASMTFVQNISCTYFNIEIHYKEHSFITK